MNYYYDLHIHSALSPCGDNSMTPADIAATVRRNGLDVFALTDHNSARNLPAAARCAREEGLVFVPGVEAESQEGVHIVCLFKEVAPALVMGAYLEAHLPDIQNREEIFGEQWIFSEEGQIAGKEPRLLISSTELTIREIFDKVRELGGCGIFAHLERASYSVISNLGCIPADLEVTTVEVSASERGDAFLAQNPVYSAFNILRSSDSHWPLGINRRVHFLDIDRARQALRAADVIERLRKGRGEG